MDYKKIYNELCKRGQDRKRLNNEYYEVHHIIPRCMGGTDDIQNLTTLTAREHFIAHLILIELYPEINGLHFAAWLMINDSIHIEKVSARTYERLKKEWSIRMKKLRTGTVHSDEVKKKMSDKKRALALKTRGSLGMKWYHNPLTKENILCLVDDVPIGYIKGRFIPNDKKPKKGSVMWIYNVDTLEYKQIKGNEDIPDGWSRGTGRGKTKSIHNPNTMERKYIPISDDVPDGWILGIGSLSEEHKNKIGESNKVALTKYYKNVKNKS